MYTQKISIRLQTETDRAAAIAAFQLLLDFYRGSGQICGRYQSAYYTADELVAMPLTLLKNALSPENNNFYVNRQIAIVQQLCRSELAFELMGTIAEADQQPSAKSVSADNYVLKTDYYVIGSPVISGKTNEMVPLYRLPQYYDFGYMPILSWETNYKACDDLFMNDEVGGNRALKQLQDSFSSLSLQGREICKKVEALSGTKTYYYLFNYRKKDDPFCPSCGKKWRLLPELLAFEYACESCRLVSNKTSRS